MAPLVYVCIFHRYHGLHYQARSLCVILLFVGAGLLLFFLLPNNPLNPLSDKNVWRRALAKGGADVVIKNNEAAINYNGEFGFEMQLVIPYAYYCHKKGLKLKTISSKFTKPLYYFSENHIEKYDRRTSRYQIIHQIRAHINII